MYKCKYCGPVSDCTHRRERSAIKDSAICQDVLKNKYLGQTLRSNDKKTTLFICAKQNVVPFMATSDLNNNGGKYGN